MEKALAVPVRRSPLALVDALNREWAALVVDLPEDVPALVEEARRGDDAALHRLVAAPAVARLVGGPDGAGAMRARLAGLLGGAWRERYRKAAPPRGRGHPEKARRSGAHTSVFRLQQGHRQRAISKT